MRKGLRSRSWFALLRRDRLLFAFTAAFLLVTHLLQPLAEAHATGLGGAGTICRLGEVSSFAPVGNHEPASDHCPQCGAGPCAGLALPAHDAVIDDALALPASDRCGQAVLQTAALRELAGEPPPAIRAPPSFV
jgi:hypothetical protein